MSLNYASGCDVPDVLQPPAAKVTGPPTRGESLFRAIRDRQNERDRACKSMYTRVQQRTLRCSDCRNHFRVKGDLCWYCHYYRLELEACKMTCTACLWTGPSALFVEGVCQSCRFVAGGDQDKQTSVEPSTENIRVPDIEECQKVLHSPRCRECRDHLGASCQSHMEYGVCNAFALTDQLDPGTRGFLAAVKAMNPGPPYHG